METEPDFEAAAQAVEFLIKIAERSSAEATDERHRRHIELFVRACSLVRGALLEVSKAARSNPNLN